MATINSYQQKDYSGGLNDTASPSELKSNEAAVLYNWDITYRGQLRLRPGLTLIGTSIGSSPITGLYSYEKRSAGSKDLVAVSGTTLYYLNSSTWTSLDTGFTTALPMCFETCDINGKLYMANGTEYTHSWDRASTTNNSCLTDLGSTIPTGKIIKWYKNFMFTINNVKWGGTTYKNRMAWSALGDPDTWDTTNDFIDIPGQGAGVTFGEIGDALIVFKERSHLFFTGWGDTDWRISATSSSTVNIAEDFGTLSPYGGTRVGNEWWQVDDEGQIRRIYQTDTDAFRRDIISTKIQDTLATVNKAQLSKVRAWTYNDKVYFAFPTGTSLVPDIVCVYDLIASRRTNEEAWTTYTGWSIGVSALHAPSSVPVLYLGSAATGKTWSHDGDDDEGEDIAARWDGGRNSFKTDDIVNRFKFGYITGEAGSDAEVTFHASVDSSPFALLGTLNLTGSGSRLGPTGSFLLGPTGDATLGGAAENTLKYDFASGGGNPLGGNLQTSIRYTGSNGRPIVRGHSAYYKSRHIR